MIARNFLLSAIAAATLALPGPALAQAGFDLAELTAGCTAGHCSRTVAAILARLRRLGLTQAQINSVLGQMAGALVQLARTDPAIADDVGASLELVAEESTDSVQRAAIRQVAQIVAAGDAETIDLGTAVAGSAT
ncbi:hypothetical protein [Frigidibacter sp. ROC022]|uniref:hypothetical protein n=1 Tax=Frigidibacter sp. ROC022 TaxID=2971796 RepID=UPI00215B0381|nr:hypothetical protein [Frigidibacter sp. ROC022]MCR8723856.1 hypothetical protein [Frigidibacter sp. ROC022]